MGNNINFCDLLNLPKKVTCPRCRRLIYSGFDEYDIDCGSPEAAQSNEGLMTLDVYCSTCNYNFEVKVKSTIEIEEFHE